jgi:predicted nucleic acid-binding protein
MIVYDTGALLAAEANQRTMWVLHDAALRNGIIPTISATVLAQAWRGGPQPQLSRLLKGCEVDPLTEQAARAAGVACAASATSDIVDAAVVVDAIARRALVVTSDPRDLARIAEALDAPLDLHQI